MNTLKLIRAILFWLLFAAIRLPLVIIGWVVVPWTDPEKNPVWGNREHPVPPKWYRPESKYRDYLWRAWRNPTNNLRYLFDEPKVYDYLLGDVDVDEVTRTGKKETGWHLIVAGWFFEYWYQRKCKDGAYFELRVGWKFGKSPGFGHTIQFRKGD